MIKDLFSHKIHSSGDDWPDKLVELAAIFNEFHGLPYNREAIENRLMEISPRAACAPRDASKFRDEISAYPAYLGLYKLSPSKQGWVIRLSRAAQSYLVREEPDVAAFLRLQLSLFQYPNGMGVAYKSGTNNVRIQANARNRTLAFIKEGIHVSPLRLIIAGILADSKIRDVDDLDGELSFEEIFVLANDDRTNQTASPGIELVCDVLTDFRQKKIERPRNFERRFHILKHTDLFDISKNKICFRTPVNNRDRGDLLLKIYSICELKIQFNGFDKAKSGQDIEQISMSGKWSEYFDSIATLRGKTINRLAQDIINEPVTDIVTVSDRLSSEPTSYTLSDRHEYVVSTTNNSRSRELADPEVTKIKRQKRNLAHKLLIDKMCDYLAKLKASLRDNPHIDLYAEIPNDGSFLFEMKSGGENYLDQIRKGLSQLYEYRFRYKKNILPNTTLCLVVPPPKNTKSWLFNYLCSDRGICICWFNTQGSLEFPTECSDKMGVIIPGQENI